MTVSEDLDFEPLFMNVTFDADVIEQVVQVIIINDDILEYEEEFMVTIEAVPGPFPVEVINGRVNIELSDNDCKICFFCTIQWNCY